MQKLAFVVGIGVSGISDDPLPSAVRDARAIHAFLAGNDPRVHIDVPWSVSPVVAEHPSEQVGRYKDLAAKYLSWRHKVKQAQKAEDGSDLHVLVYFAGHAAGDGPSRVPGDAPTSVALKASDGPWMKVADLFESVVDLGARNTTFILDCCYAGEATAALRSLIANGKRTDGVAVFAACADTQQASSGGTMGEFTSLVLKGLGRDPTIAQGPVTAPMLHQYLLDHWRDLPPYIRDVQSPDILALPTAGTIPLVTVTGRPAGASLPDALRPTPASPGHDLVVGPYGEIQVQQVGRHLSLAWVIRPTGACRPWSAPVVVAPGERALAVAALSDRSGAFVLLSGAAATRILRAQPDGETSSVMVPGAEECASGRFGIGRDMGTIFVTPPGGAEQRHDLLSLFTALSPASVR